MPELLEVTTSVERFDPPPRGRPLLGVRSRSPSLSRTVEPPLAALRGREPSGVERLGTRIVFARNDWPRTLDELEQDGSLGPSRGRR